MRSIPNPRQSSVCSPHFLPPCNSPQHTGWRQDYTWDDVSDASESNSQEPPDWRNGCSPENFSQEAFDWRSECSWGDVSDCSEIEHSPSHSDSPLPSQKNSLDLVGRSSIDGGVQPFASGDGHGQESVAGCASKRNPSRLAGKKNRDSSYEPSDDDPPPPPTRTFSPTAQGEQNEPGAITSSDVGPELALLRKENQEAYLQRKASPYEWLEVLGNLDVLAPKQWLSQKVICRLLMDMWWPLRHDKGTHLIYLPLEVLHEISTAVQQRGVSYAGFDKGPFVSQYSSLIPYSSHKRIGFILIRNLGSMQRAQQSDPLSNPNHFFTVVFDYDLQRAFSFGAFVVAKPPSRCEVATKSNWDMWLGPKLWTGLACSLGWEDSLRPFNEVYVISKEWNQNGYDCGVYSVKIMSQLIQGRNMDGLLDAEQPVAGFDCLHSERKEILRSTMENIHRSHALYEELPGLRATQPLAIGEIDEISLSLLRSRTFGLMSQFVQVLRKLEEATLQCSECTYISPKPKTLRKVMKPVIDELVVNRRHIFNPGATSNPSRRFRPDEVGKVEGEGVHKTVLPTQGGSGPGKGSDPGDSSGPEDSSDPGDSSGPEDSSDAPELGGSLVHQSTVWEGDNTILLPTQSLARPLPIKCLPKSSVKAYGLLDGSQEVRVRKFHLKHDEYHTGPTVEDFLTLYRDLVTCFETKGYDFNWISATMRFRDHGYRMLPGSLDQFYLNNPRLDDQLAHFFPTPSTETIMQWRRKISAPPTAKEPLSLDRRAPLPSTCITGNDMVEWGLQEMIKNSGEEGSATSKTAFVVGKTYIVNPKGDFIKLNVTKDQVQPSSVSISMDIDSIIWLTPRLKFKGSTNIYTSPYRQENAPIHASTHLYIELLLPRLDEDMVDNRLSSSAREIPLSNLPNTHFATFGRVEGSAKVAVVFPRMKHRYPLRRHWETRLLEEVELLWLRNVVYAALHRLESTGIRPYVSYSYEDTRWRHTGAQETTQPLSPEQLDELQDHIDAILQENTGNPSYDCFRSYFFVLDMRGIKVPTSSDNTASKAPWDSLTGNYPMLDWRYMEDPEHGELLIDIGFGFHPPPDIPLVGFWRSDVLRLGFDYGGYAQGTNHSECTIPTIGGINAEMPKARRLRVHIAYRQAYNLAFETIRGKLTREGTGYFSAESAYHEKEDYAKNIRQMKEAFSRNCTRSYGVRDEYRCRVTAIRLLSSLAEKAQRYLEEMDPILWIPSHLWFTFLRRRAAELSDVQGIFSRMRNRPTNYALLTLILTHMLQHIGTTPVSKDSYLNQALGDLRFHSISQRFGCFFLHDLDIWHGKLPGVEKVDHVGLLRRLNAEGATHNYHDSSSDSCPEDEPSPSAVTWNELYNSLNNLQNKRAIINPFRWHLKLLVFSAAERLFCDFTAQFWMLQSEGGFRPLTRPPVTMKEAMDIWTLDSVDGRIKHKSRYLLVPSSDKLTGAVPKKYRLCQFKLLRERFFPEPDSTFQEDSFWHTFSTMGYLKDFHHAIKASRDGGESLRNSLDGIFAELQILPYNPGQPNQKTPLWRWKKSEVKLLLNASYVQLLDRRIKKGDGEERGEGFKKLLSNQQLYEKLSSERFNPGSLKRKRQQRPAKSKNWRNPPAKRQKLA